jgi:hypothetical protein
MGTIKQLSRWLTVIGLLLLPPILIRVSAYDIALRILGYCFLIAFAIGFFSYMLCYKSLLKGTTFESGLDERGRKIVELSIRGFCLLAVIVGLWMASSFFPSLITFIRDPSNVKTEEHVVGRTDSVALPGAFYVHMDVHTDDGKTLSLMYPDPILQVGHRYLFTLLPESDFVLTATLTQ